MKAKVVEIQSKLYRTSTTPHPYRVIALQFDLPLVNGGPVILRLPESCLDIIGLDLDDEVIVSFDLPEDSVTEADIEEETEEPYKGHCTDD